MMHNLGSISKTESSYLANSFFFYFRSQALTTHLAELSHTAPQLPVSIPPEIVEYVESGRNPDIYTREFVELVQRSNEHMKGKTLAFRSFRDVLAEEICGALPALRDQVERVLQETGGRTPLNGN